MYHSCIYSVFLVSRTKIVYRYLPKEDREPKRNFCSECDVKNLILTNSMSMILKYGFINAYPYIFKFLNNDNNNKINK
jgi:hypothetical protein